MITSSETWITPQDDITSLKIVGYNIITDNRTFSIGGGVALYLKSNFEYHLRNDFKIAGVENICPDTEDMLICVIQIPPSRSQRYFIDEFEKVLHATFMSFLCLILGVFNINTLVKRTIANECLDLIHSEGINPLIFVATFITESRTSCIKHILSNSFLTLCLQLLVVALL